MTVFFVGSGSKALHYPTNDHRINPIITTNDSSTNSKRFEAKSQFHFYLTQINRPMNIQWRKMQFVSIQVKIRACKHKGQDTYVGVMIDQQESCDRIIMKFLTGSDGKHSRGSFNSSLHQLLSSLSGEENSSMRKRTWKRHFQEHFSFVTVLLFFVNPLLPLTMPQQ